MNPEITKLYQDYVALGRKLLEVLKPTPEEIKDINYEMADLGMEDLLCDPYQPEMGGDMGLLGCLVYERRCAIEEETNGEER